MKIKELKDVLKSARGYIQLAIVFDSKEHKDIEGGCSIDYAVAHYGDRELIRIEAYENQLVLYV